MKKKIKIRFVDFWGDFDSKSNFITEILNERYELEYSDSPDYLFFGTFGYNHLKYDCVKIMFIGENIAPDFNLCDYAIGFDHIQFDDRYLRIPLYQIYSCFSELSKPKHISEEALLNRNFCCIVVSNARYASPHRERFFRLLSEYKKVDSGGRLWNNIGGPVEDKLLFVSKYKFNIAFENSSVLGYTTEKIMEPMAVNTMPIYWGNRWVDYDFNPSSFINVNNFPSLEAVVEHIVEIDNNEAKYLEMMCQPWVINEDILKWRERLSFFLFSIIEKPIEEAKYLSEYGQQKLYRQELLASHILSDKLRLKKIMAAYDKIKQHKL